MTKRGMWVGGAIAIVAVAAIVVTAVLWPRGDTEPVAETQTPTPTVSETPTSTPTPTPTPTGPPANTNDYEAGDLPRADVFGIHPDLPVDDAPGDEAAGIIAHPESADGAPVFADPAGEPVAWLGQEQQFSGSNVPVVELEENWARVLLVGRQAPAGQGDASQLSGWMRVDDLVLTPTKQSVNVDLAARTIVITTDDGDSIGNEIVGTDFASGTDATPTPLGRTFIMFEDTVESLGYTRGHPIVYLGVQSPTLAGYDGQSVAVTAFHYHDVRSGAISNGCIRVAPETIEALAALPEGTPVYIS
ncbi:L,D-transpeptidase [Microbacterium sorbitolivorans]|nr:L,D-transpeptidase [Microbacterium sorbitolivorans]